MDFTKIFEDLALQENANYSLQNNKYRAGKGTFILSKTHTLKYVYRDIEITLKNEYGHQDNGEIKCQLDLQPENCEFSITTLNRFSQWLNRKKNPLIFKGENTQLHNFIDQNKYFNELIQIAKNESFEPTIKGENLNEQFCLSCQYHLVFNNQELVLSHLIKLFKSIIDFYADNRLKYN